MLSVTEILGPGGRIAARLPHYEHRPQQLAMAEGVAAALAGQRHLVAEAGTGVGKSFAYLIPAILHVTAGKEQTKRGAGFEDEDRPCEPGRCALRQEASGQEGTTPTQR